MVGIGVFTVDARADKGRQQIATMKDPKRLAAASAEFGYYKCLESTLRKAVPTGARVMLRNQQQISAEYQRLTEMATPWYRIVDRPARGVWIVSIDRTGSSPVTCGGFAVKGRRV